MGDALAAVGAEQGHQVRRGAPTAGCGWRVGLRSFGGETAGCTMVRGRGAAEVAALVGDRRAHLRQEHFGRPLYWLRRVVVGLAGKALPRSELGKACAYLLEN